MKTLIQVVVIVLFAWESKSQNMMTIGEVFDFDVNDEFHFSNTAQNTTPNATRFKITFKYFSVMNDTVFYTRYNSNYYTIVNYTNGPPQLDYYYSTYTDSVYYTALDSLINYPSSIWQVDSCNTFSDTLYYSSQYCGNLVYEYNYCYGCCFEGHYYHDIYGKGLGQVLYSVNVPSEFHQVNKVMQYYKKGTTECGTPITTSILETEKTTNKLLIYPNPASSKIQISINNILNYTYSIINSTGQLITMGQVNQSLNNSSIDISKLKDDLYFVLVESEKGNYGSKFIKK